MQNQFLDQTGHKTLYMSGLMEMREFSTGLAAYYEVQVYRVLLVLATLLVDANCVRQSLSQPSGQDLLEQKYWGVWRSLNDVKIRLSHIAIVVSSEPVMEITITSMVSYTKVVGILCVIDSYLWEHFLEVEVVAHCLARVDVIPVLVVASDVCVGGLDCGHWVLKPEELVSVGRHNMLGISWSPNNHYKREEYYCGSSSLWPWLSE